jgi:Uma2 family endonuclease
MVSTRTKPITVEELWELRHEPYRLALIDGELHRMPGAGGTHGALHMFLGAHLVPFVISRKLGRLYADTGFILFPDRDTTLFPDIAFVRTEKIPSLEREEKFLRLVPDLAMEIVSPTDYPKLLDEKLSAYMDARTPGVWRFYPRARSIRVFRPGKEMVILGPEDILDGEDILPGFRIRVADLFKAPDPGVEHSER